MCQVDRDEDELGTISNDLQIGSQQTRGVQKSVEELAEFSGTT